MPITDRRGEGIALYYIHFRDRWQSSIPHYLDASIHVVIVLPCLSSWFGQMTFRDPLQPKPFSENDIPVGQVEEELPLDTQQWELGEHRSITLDNAKILRY